MTCASPAIPTLCPKSTCAKIELLNAVPSRERKHARPQSSHLLRHDCNHIRCETMFRILSLDGGGIKGVCTASVLASFEADTKLKTIDHVDLIAGTSTGGILAIGLAM